MCSSCHWRGNVEHWLASGSVLLALSGCSLLLDSRSDGDDLVASDAETASTCPPSYTEVHESSRYELGQVNLDWYQAQELCEAAGTHLVVVETAEEHAFLVGLDYTGWIGASDHRFETVFLWVTDAGVPLVGDPGFQAWSDGQPDDLFVQEDCVRHIEGGEWEDRRCDSRFSYVCECDGAAPLVPTWCRTGTDTDCFECGNDCGDIGSCTGELCGL